MIPETLSPLANHLWQSTLFAGAAGLLVLALKKNRAAVRYGLWLAASVKFLLPFSLLVAIGRQFEWPADRVKAPTALVSAVEGFSQPFAYQSPIAPSALPLPLSESVPAVTSGIPTLLFLMWLCGAAVVGLAWFREWQRLRVSLKSASPVGLKFPIRVLTTSVPTEPGIVGILRPALLLPDGLMDRLTPAQIDAVLTHELCHVRRRDNLAAALHMVVETVFWFHPLVWWIEHRLVEERERACDEEVLQRGGEPQAYAEGILNVCKFYKESPLVCVSGVAGSNLKKRIEDIMRNRVARKLSFSRSALITVAGLTAFACPIVIGAVHATVSEAQPVPAISSPAAAVAASPAAVAVVRPAVQNPTPVRVAFEEASVRISKASQVEGARGNNTTLLGCSAGPAQVDPRRFAINDMNVHTLIAMAYATPGNDCTVLSMTGRLTGGPGWIRSDQFDVEAVIPEGTPGYTPRQFRNGDAPNLQMMLQTLLADRFKVRVHREMKELPVFALTLGNAKDTAQFSKLTADSYHPRPDEPPPGSPESRNGVFGGPLPGQRLVSGRNVSLEDLIPQLETFTGRPVVNRTGITGKFNFDLHFDNLPDEVPTQGIQGLGRPLNAGSHASLLKSIQEQLGLKVESTKAPVDVLVIDRVDRLSEN